ncbi:GNAT family N-acetyltransferase [Lederbergia citrea]|uniref:GNAT family N-acetyltransferase n=1 Tax=Lederbergia citrea TaxID=2833581 RepID=A0A942UMZ0_9BACI|nr:GNAT family N-acetyltransferase [Lederbergia citrea]MBS4221876.1 GNAT family N-acetyltransferase [Lederbergia citrea]
MYRVNEEIYGLWPLICALYIENSYRGMSLGKELLLRAKADAEKAGFNKVFLCTDHIGYYEKYGFTYIGDGYHPWGSSSRIYESNNENIQQLQQSIQQAVHILNQGLQAVSSNQVLDQANQAIRQAEQQLNQVSKQAQSISNTNKCYKIE